MTKKDIEQIIETLSVIVGQPMRDFTRSGDMLFFHFGELVEVNTLKVAEDVGLARDDGQFIPVKEMMGQYSLHSLCGMRFVCGNDVIFAKGDIFIPSEELTHEKGFGDVWGDFDWQTQGNTLFDELFATHFRGDFSGYIVENVKVSKFGDLTISFENDFALEFHADVSGYSTNWSFGEINSTESLNVSSKGIVNETI